MTKHYDMSHQILFITRHMWNLCNHIWAYLIKYLHNQDERTFLKNVALIWHVLLTSKPVANKCPSSMDIIFDVSSLMMTRHRYVTFANLLSLYLQELRSKANFVTDYNHVWYYFSDGENVSFQLINISHATDHKPNKTHFKK